MQASWGCQQTKLEDWNGNFFKPTHLAFQTITVICTNCSSSTDSPSWLFESAEIESSQQLNINGWLRITNPSAVCHIQIIPGMKRACESQDCIRWTIQGQSHVGQEMHIHIGGCSLAQLPGECVSLVCLIHTVFQNKLKSIPAETCRNDPYPSTPHTHIHFMQITNRNKTHRDSCPVQRRRHGSHLPQGSITSAISTCSCSSSGTELPSQKPAEPETAVRRSCHRDKTQTTNSVLTISFLQVALGAMLIEKRSRNALKLPTH